MKTSAPTLLLEHHLKALRLPVFVREHSKVAAQCATDKAHYAGFLLRLSEAELLERERKAAERRIKAARFPAVKSLDDFDFLAVPALNRQHLVELSRCEWIDRRENVILLTSALLEDLPELEAVLVHELVHWWQVRSDRAGPHGGQAWEDEARAFENSWRREHHLRLRPPLPPPNRRRP